MESQEEALCECAHRRDQHDQYGCRNDLGGCNSPSLAHHPFKPAPLPSPASTPAPTKETALVIDEFRGRWMRLSNYSLITIMHDGHAYMSVEHAYQAMKSLDPTIQKEVRDAPTPAGAKRIARAVALRPDWEEVKVDLMRSLLREKFCQEPEQSLLLATGYADLVEGNWWHDQFWGRCSCPKHGGEGENWLGRLLMELREEIARA